MVYSFPLSLFLYAYPFRRLRTALLAVFGVIMSLSEFMMLPPGPFGPDSIPFVFKRVGSVLHNDTQFGFETCGAVSPGELVSVPLSQALEFFCPSCEQDDFYTVRNAGEEGNVFVNGILKLASFLVERLHEHEKLLTSAQSASFPEVTGEVFASDFKAFALSGDLDEFPFALIPSNLMPALGWDRVYDSLLSELMVSQVLSRGLAGASLAGGFFLADFSAYVPLGFKSAVKNTWLYSNPRSFLDKERFPVFSASAAGKLRTLGVEVFRCPHYPDDRVLETLSALFVPLNPGPYCSFAAAAEAAFAIEND